PAPPVIGLKCSGAMDFRRLRARLRRYRNAGQRIRLNRPSAGADLNVVSEDDNRNLERLDSEEMKLSACRTCPDLLAEASDLTVGADARMPDRNVVLTWTERGRAYWDQAVRAGLAVASPLGESELEVLEDEAQNKRARALDAIAMLRAKDLDVPYVKDR